MKNIVTLLLALFICTKVPAQTQSGDNNAGHTTNAQNGNIDWEAFDNSSSVPPTAITLQQMQGLWKAYRGLYRFNGVINGMNLTTPFTIEVKGNTCDRSSKGKFNPCTLLANHIIISKNGVSDTGIINKISATELTISWKSGQNYTRYYYQQ